MQAVCTHGCWTWQWLTTCRVLVELPGRHSSIFDGFMGHLEHLRKVVQAHTKAGIKIQPKKTKIFHPEVEYLGHKVSQIGEHMLEDFIKNVQKWPPPTISKEMSSFLGFTGYYRSFIPRYSALTNRMNSMKKALKFEWSEDMEKDFKKLKAEFTAGKIQAYPDFDSNKPFALTTDWSA